MAHDIMCPNCGVGHMQYATKNVQISRKGMTAIVPNIAGLFCDNCEEIDFDNETDSANRYAAVGDELVLKARQKALEIGAKLKAARLRVGLTQIEASALSGGGHNAFSRYESGVAQPVAAVINLFQILERHPELVKELDRDLSIPG